MKFDQFRGLGPRNDDTIAAASAGYDHSRALAIFVVKFEVKVESSSQVR